jgi:hypothetical protein
MIQFSAVKVFSSTLARDRDVMGERISQWLREHPELTPVETEVTQTSDREYHCLTVTVFLQGDVTKLLGERPSTVLPVRPTASGRTVVPTSRR